MLALRRGHSLFVQQVGPTTSEADGYKPTLRIYNLPDRALQA